MSKSAAQRAGGATARANWHYGPCGQGRGPVQRQAAWGRGSWQGKGANPGHGGRHGPAPRAAPRPCVCLNLGLPWHPQAKGHPLAYLAAWVHKTGTKLVSFASV